MPTHSLDAAREIPALPALLSGLLAHADWQYVSGHNSRHPRRNRGLHPGSNRRGWGGLLGRRHYRIAARRGSDPAGRPHSNLRGLWSNSQDRTGTPVAAPTEGMAETAVAVAASSRPAPRNPLGGHPRRKRCRLGRNRSERVQQLRHQREQQRGQCRRRHTDQADGITSCRKLLRKELRRHDHRRGLQHRRRLVLPISSPLQVHHRLEHARPPPRRLAGRERRAYGDLLDY